MTPLAAALCALALLTPAPVAADGWVGALTRLEPTPTRLTDPQEPLERRIAWARTLGRYGKGPGASAALLDALGGDDPPPPALTDALVLAIARLAPPRAVAELGRLLREPERGASAEAVAFALAAIGTPTALATLVEALERPAARRALVRAGSAATDPLNEALDGPQAAHAAALLGQLGDPRAAGALASQLRARDPDVRAAAARALGAIGARGAAHAVTGLLASRESSVRLAALEALSEIATPSERDALRRGYAKSRPGERAAYLLALCTAAPRAASPLLRAALHDEFPSVRGAALERLLEGDPDPSWLPLLLDLAREPGRADAALSAIARMPAGAGVGALAELAKKRSPIRDGAARALAVALRRWQDVLDDEARAAALVVLRNATWDERGLVLRAIAHDRELTDELPAALRATSSERRSAAALAAQFLGDADLGPALTEQLALERDAEAFRRQADAAVALGAPVVLDLLWARLDDPESGPEAIRLAAYSIEGQEAPERLRRALRRTLAVGEATRSRVAAALALARIGDSAAVAALDGALRDPSARLRLAAARALAVLHTDEARAALASHARIERNQAVRKSALEGLAAGAPALEPRGDRTLEVRIVQQRRGEHSRREVDVLLDDARWLRMRALPGGELLIADLPAGLAELRVQN